jgi:hypothetical protein
MKKLVVLSLLSALILGFTPGIYADFGDVLFPTAVGAGIGGAVGGGRGAAIGAGVGFGVGLMNESSQGNGRYYRDRYYRNDYEYERPIKYRRGGNYYREPVYQQPSYNQQGNREYLNFDPMDID